jgi:hypothetical protein
MKDSNLIDLSDWDGVETLKPTSMCMACGEFTYDAAAFEPCPCGGLVLYPENNH